MPLCGAAPTGRQALAQCRSAASGFAVALEGGNLQSEAAVLAEGDGHRGVLTPEVCPELGESRFRTGKGMKSRPESVQIA